jgi:nitrile hydratase
MATDGPHDLGGRPGFGPVPVDGERPWSAAWQQLAYALASSTARIAGVNGDALRHVMERLPAEDYRRLGSAGRWLQAAENCAVEAGLVAEGEVLDRAVRREAGLAPRPVEDYPEPVCSAPRSEAPGALPHNKRTPADDDVPHYSVGDRVLVSGRPSSGHTRLPAYLVGRSGEVVALNGFWLLPDAHATDGTEAPTWVYTVRFAAADLWSDAGPHEVCVDLFEPYLEPRPPSDPRPHPEVPGA